MMSWDIYDYICQDTNQKIRIYNPLYQTYGPTVVYKSISKTWTNVQEESG